MNQIEIVSAGSLAKSAVVYILTLLIPLQAFASVGVPAQEADSLYFELQGTSLLDHQRTSELDIGAIDLRVESVVVMEVERVVGSAHNAASSEFGSLAGVLFGLASLLAVFNCRRGRKRTGAPFGAYTEHVT